MNIKHRMTNTPTFRTWTAILKRCYNPNCEQFPRYGGRGITVCERWRDFCNFYADMGERPDGKTIDRINPDGNYELLNCRWATREEQTRNRSNTLTYEWSGRKQTLLDWADELQMPYQTLWRRLNRYGWSIERAFTEPITGNRLTVQKVIEARKAYASGATFTQLAKKYGVNRKTITQAVRGEIWSSAHEHIVDPIPDFDHPVGWTPEDVEYVKGLAK